MSLTKGEAYALYLLLTTKSELVDRLKGAASATADDFVEKLGREIVLLRQGRLKADPSDEPDVGFTDEEKTSFSGLWRGVTTNNATDFQTDSDSVLPAFKALGAEYGGGPCPKAGEQLRIFKLATALLDTPNDPTT